MHNSTTLAAGTAAWLPGGAGKTALRIASFDWSATSLGSIDQWPHSLRTITSLVVRSPVPMVLLWGPDGVMIYNDAYAVFSADPHLGRLGKKVADAWPEVADFNANVMNVVMAGGVLSYKDQELTLHRRDRPEQVWMNLDYSPVPGESGQPAGVIAIVVETTERVLADRRVEAEQKRQRQCFSQMPGFVAVLGGPAHVHEYVNSAYIKIWERDDFVGRRFAEVFPDLSGQDFLSLLDGVYRTGERYSTRGMALRLHGSGQVRFIDFVFEPIRDDQDAVIGIFVGGYEVTEAHRATIALRASEAQLKRLNETLEERISERTARLLESEVLMRTFFDHSSECHAVLVDADDGSFRYEAVNPATLRLYGKTREQVIGYTTSEIFGAANVAQLNRDLATSLEAGIPYRYERTQGSGVIEAIAAPVRGEAGSARRIVVTARDITERRRLEQQLRQAQKMEAIGQLTGGIAHDFNNLLTGISGSLELLESRLTQGRLGGIERYIAAAQSSARRAAGLTQRLLAFSRRQTLDPKATNVNRLIAGMEELIRRSIGPNVELEVVGAGGLWATRIDPSQLESALLNLSINARDAMPDGGRITIETANRWLDERGARECELPPGQYVSVSVTDNGTGMAPQVIAQAFDPFFTTKPIGQGTGLGLSMIHGFVRQSGGQVRIYSELGKGTTMSLYLPRFAGALDEVDAPEEAPAAGPGDGETVLVIDDEETVRVLITEVLQEAGYITIEAVDGPTGLKILRSDARIDLLVTDVGLPGGMNGRQVADAARTTRPTLKVLFVTGYAENAAVGNGHLDAGMEVITKPFAMAALGNKIREMIDGP